MSLSTVIMVTHSLSRQAGGLFFSVRRLAQSLSLLNLDVKVLGLWDKDFEQDRAAWESVDVKAFRCLGARALGFSPGLLRELKAVAEPSCVIHLHGLWKATSAACLQVSRETGVKRVISPRGMLDCWALRQGALRKKIAARLYENANLASAACVHALCQPEVDQIRAFGINAPVANVPNGVDPGASADHGPLPAKVRDRRILLFLSRVHPKKGLLPLLEAWAQVSSQCPDWVLVIAGPPEDNHGRELRAAIDRLGLRSSVCLVGAQYGQDKENWLHAAEAFVLPSHSEGFPMALLEALAHGLPALITPQCNFKAAVDAGAALSSEPEPESLARGLAGFLAMSRKAHAEMGRKGKELVEADYTWEAVAGRMREVYQWIAGERDRPACIVE